MGKIKIAFIVMVLITIAVGIVVAYATSTNDEEETYRHCFEYWCAIPLDEEPAYYNAENETFDPYVIEALENPDTWVEVAVSIYNKTSHEWIDEDGIMETYPGDYVKYAGNFYMIDQIWAEPPLRWFLSEEILNQTPIYVGALGSGWTAFGVGVLYVRRKPQQTAQASHK